MSTIGKTLSHLAHYVNDVAHEKPHAFSNFTHNVTLMRADPNQNPHAGAPRTRDRALNWMLALPHKQSVRAFYGEIVGRDVGQSPHQAYYQRSPSPMAYQNVPTQLAGNGLAYANYPPRPQPQTQSQSLTPPLNQFQTPSYSQAYGPPGVQPVPLSNRPTFAQVPTYPAAPNWQQQGQNRPVSPPPLTDYRPGGASSTSHLNPSATPVPPPPLQPSTLPTPVTAQGRSSGRRDSSAYPVPLAGTGRNRPPQSPVLASSDSSVAASPAANTRNRLKKAPPGNTGTPVNSSSGRRRPPLSLSIPNSPLAKPLGQVPLTPPPMTSETSQRYASLVAARQQPLDSRTKRTGLPAPAPLTADTDSAISSPSIIEADSPLSARLKSPFSEAEADSPLSARLPKSLFSEGEADSPLSARVPKSPFSEIEADTPVVSSRPKMPPRQSQTLDFSGLPAAFSGLDEDETDLPGQQSPLREERGTSPLASAPLPAVSEESSPLPSPSPSLGKRKAMSGLETQTNSAASSPLQSPDLSNRTFTAAELKTRFSKLAAATPVSAPMDSYFSPSPTDENTRFFSAVSTPTPREELPPAKDETPAVATYSDQSRVPVKLASTPVTEKEQQAIQEAEEQYVEEQAAAMLAQAQPQPPATEISLTPAQQKVHDAVEKAALEFNMLHEKVKDAPSAAKARAALTSLIEQAIGLAELPVTPGVLQLRLFARNAAFSVVDDFSPSSAAGKLLMQPLDIPPSMAERAAILNAGVVMKWMDLTPIKNQTQTSNVAAILDANLDQLPGMKRLEVINYLCAVLAERQMSPSSKAQIGGVLAGQLARTPEIRNAGELTTELAKSLHHYINLDYDFVSEMDVDEQEGYMNSLQDLILLQMHLPEEEHGEMIQGYSVLRGMLEAGEV